jgi:hypothetical protein
VDLHYDASSQTMFIVDVVKGSMTAVAVGQGQKVNPSSTSSAAARSAMTVLALLLGAVAAAF